MNRKSNGTCPFHANGTSNKILNNKNSNGENLNKNETEIKSISENDIRLVRTSWKELNKMGDFKSTELI